MIRLIMKKNNNIVKVLLFSGIFLICKSSPTVAEWDFIGETKKGYNLYIDHKNINVSFGHKHFFALYDFLIPNKYGTMSVISYYKLSCHNLKYKSINDKMYKEPMGKGNMREIDETNEIWRRAKNVLFSNKLNEICSYQS